MAVKMIPRVLPAPHLEPRREPKRITLTEVAKQVKTAPARDAVVTPLEASSSRDHGRAEHLHGSERKPD